MAQTPVRTTVSNNSLSVDLAPEDLARLEKFANARGISTAALCAKAIASLLHRKERDPGTFRRITIAGRMTEAEALLVKSKADQRGISVAEWVREELCRQLDPEHRALVYELDALRQLLLGIIAHLATHGREITIAQLKKLQDEADDRATKRATAALGKQRRGPIAIAPPQRPEVHR